MVMILCCLLYRIVIIKGSRMSRGRSLSDNYNTDAKKMRDEEEKCLARLSNMLSEEKA